MLLSVCIDCCCCCLCALIVVAAVYGMILSGRVQVLRVDLVLTADGGGGGLRNNQRDDHSCQSAQDQADWAGRAQRNYQGQPGRQMGRG